jgi:hypothetical protein
VGELVACASHAGGNGYGPEGYQHWCPICREGSDRASQQAATSLRADADSASSEELQAASDKLTELEPGGRYNVDRRNDLTNAFRGASAEDLDLLSTIFDLADNGVTEEQRARFIELRNELYAAVDDIGYGVAHQLDKERAEAERRQSRRDMENAHGAGLHDDAPREFCPECELRGNRL